MSMPDKVGEFLKNHVGEWNNKQERELRKLVAEAEEAMRVKCAAKVEEIMILNDHLMRSNNPLPAGTKLYGFKDVQEAILNTGKAVLSEGEGE